ncbi:hypothetical protein DENSPDRAFT_872513 [Dentipellis sp. KUC8613]|nr:hypothetical protein DENSPDRAFT_872513 [Dentipellis sp. KUC8613]
MVSTLQQHKLTTNRTKTSRLERLNEDCIALVLAYLSNSSLISLAATSKPLHKHAQPALVRAPSFSTSNPSRITAFCALISTHTPSLAPSIHALTLLHDAFDDTPTAPFIAALPALAAVLASATSLTALRIPIYADALLAACPALAARAPSWHLELGGLDSARSPWLAAHPPTGLRALSLGFTAAEPHALRLAAPSAHALVRLALSGAQDESMPIAFSPPTEEGAPVPVPVFAQLRMLSLSYVATTLAALAHFFPRVRVVSTRWAELADSTEGGGEGGQVRLSELLAANGAMDGVLLLLAQPSVRLVRLHEWFSTRGEFALFVARARKADLRSVSLLVHVCTEVQNYEDADGGGGGKEDELEGVPPGTLPLEHFFAELVRAAPELSYLELDFTPWFPHREVGTMPEAENWASWDAIANSAIAHLSALAHLRFLTLRFPTTYDEDDDDEDDDVPTQSPEVHFHGLAARVLAALPRAEYVFVEMTPFEECVGRGGRVVEPWGEEGLALRRWYQFEGADGRLAGVGEWLDDVDGL